MLMLYSEKAACFAAGMFPSKLWVWVGGKRVFLTTVRGGASTVVVWRSERASVREDARTSLPSVVVYHESQTPDSVTRKERHLRREMGIELVHDGSLTSQSFLL